MCSGGETSQQGKVAPTGKIASGGTELEITDNDSLALVANPIAAVVNDRVFRQVADCRQLDAAWPVQAKVDRDRLTAANHFALRHGELSGLEMTNLA